MSTYNGRRGPNVSQYLRDLNTVSPQENGEEAFNLEDDLALFTNMQFFDFDSGQNTDFQAQPVNVKVDVEATRTAAPSEELNSAAASTMGDMPNMDFIAGDFNFPDFTNSYPTPSVTGYADGASGFPALQPNQASAFNGQSGQAPFAQGSANGGEKRKSESQAARHLNLNFEEASRHAAEEDKRRRNTAASARFRIKKKQREQALEKSAKEMSDKMSSLESKVSQLETENKWLKNLLVDKNEGNEEISTLWKEFTKHASERTSKSKKAVDTEAKR